jgi:2'-5' RNA ligase
VTVKRLEIMTENGALKRVTVEHRVADVPAITALQQEASGQIGTFRSKPADDLHMTLYHFGKPESLWVEIQESGSKVTFEEFLNGFIKLLEVCEHVVPEPFSLQVESLAQFGSPQNPTLVLKLDMPGWLKERRRVIGERVEQLLRDCGVEAPETFMDQSPNLHHELDEHYKPHVSLGRMSNKDPLPELSIEAIQVQLGPSHLRNVRVAV